MPVIPGFALTTRPGMTLQQSLTLLSRRATHGGTPHFHNFVRRDPSHCLISFEACGATRNKHVN
jgi:hypothetical protein